MRDWKMPVVVCAVLVIAAGFSAMAQTKGQEPPPQVAPRPQPPKPQAPAAPAPAKGFVGRWNSDWGLMQIDIVNGKVAGVYETRKGRIEGELSPDGRTLTGFWRQAPSYSVGDDGGPFLFTLSPNGDSFEGTIWYGESRGGKAQDFGATREKPGAGAPRPRKPRGPQKGSYTGRWNSDWGLVSLEVKDSAVTGTFSKDGGRIQGTLSADGTVFSGTWSKAPSYKVGADGGALLLKLSQDGNLLQGTFWHSETMSGLGTRWQAKRAP